ETSSDAVMQAGTTECIVPESCTWLAFLTRTNLPQICIRIDSGRMSVVPVELDGVMANGRCTSDADHIFPVDRQWIGRRLDYGGTVTAGRARAALPQVCVGVNRLMAVIPLDQHPARSRKL